VQVYLQSGGLDTVSPLHNGQAALSYSVDENRVTLEFGPVDFIQVNRDVNVSMVRKAVELLDPTSSDSVLDLFCGLGNFSLSLGKRARRVVGVEGDAALVAKAKSQRCPQTESSMRAFMRTTSSSRAGPDHGPKMPMIWCFWTPQGRARLKSWNVCHSGARAGSCIFRVIQGVWLGMPGSWWVPTGSG